MNYKYISIKSIRVIQAVGHPLPIQTSIPCVDKLIEDIRVELKNIHNNPVETISSILSKTIQDPAFVSALIEATKEMTVKISGTHCGFPQVILALEKLNKDASDDSPMVLVKLIALPWKSVLHNHIAHGFSGLISGEAVEQVGEKNHGEYMPTIIEQFNRKSGSVSVDMQRSDRSHLLYPATPVEHLLTEKFGKSDVSIKLKDLQSISSEIPLLFHIYYATGGINKNQNVNDLIFLDYHTPPQKPQTIETGKIIHYN